MSQDCNVKLPAEIDLMYAEQLKVRLCEALDQSSSIALDGTEVSRVSSSCLQIILAAARAAEAGGGSLSLIGPSDTLVEAFTDLGLQDECQQWSAHHA